VLRVRVASPARTRWPSPPPRAGAPVVSIDSLRARLISADQLTAARAAYHDALFRLDWTQLPLDETAAAGPARNWTSSPYRDRVSAARTVVADAHSAVHVRPRPLQNWLPDEANQRARRWCDPRRGCPR